MDTHHPCYRISKSAAMMLLATAMLPGKSLADDVYQASWFAHSAPATAFDLVSRISGNARVRTTLATDDLLVDGLGSGYQQIEINGIAIQTTPSSVHRLLERIPFSEIDAVEIRKAPDYQSDFGGGAGATINVILKSNKRQQVTARWQPDEEYAGGLHIAAGNEGQWQLAAGKLWQRYQLRGDFNDASSDPHTRWQQDRKQQDQIIRMSYQWQPSTQRSWAANLIYLGGKQSFDQTALPLSLRFDARQPDQSASNFESDNHSFIWNLQSRRRWDTLETRLMISGQRIREDVHSDDVADQNSQQRHKLEWRIRETWNEHRWSASLSWLRRVLSSSLSNPTLVTDNGQTLRFRENRLSGHLADHWLLTPATNLTVGLRVDSYELQQGDESEDVATATYWLPNTRLEYQLDDFEQLSFSIGQAVKPVQASDRIPHQLRSSSITWQGNPDLEDEVTTQSRVEYRQKFRVDQPANHYGLVVAASQRLISGALYYRQQDDEITPLNSEEPTMIRALSASYHNRLTPAGIPLQLMLSGSLFKTEVQRPQTNGGDRTRISQTPDSQWQVGISHWLTPQLRIGTNWQHLGNSSLTALGSDGEVSINSSRSSRASTWLHYGTKGGWSMGLSLDHQRGERYQEDSDDFTIATQPGWQWNLSLKWQQ